MISLRKKLAKMDCGFQVPAHSAKVLKSKDGTMLLTLWILKLGFEALLDLTQVCK